MPPDESVSHLVSVSSERKLAAIMFTDIVGFSRQIGSDEARMLRLLEVHNQIVHHAVSAHHGHVIKTIGDAFLVDFPSFVRAVQCAQQIQSQLQVHNAGKENPEQIHVCIGMHLGDGEEAIAALKKSLNGSPADLTAHLLLAAVYSELGRDAEAQVEAAEVLQINPSWSLKVWKPRVPYKDPTTLERVFAALRKTE